MSTITKEQAQKIIEAADEVITALAGTNEDVHPESDSMLRLWDDLNDRYAPPEVVRELARIALASLEAEPVAYMHRSGQVVTREECCDDKTFAICCKVETPLYTAPHSPVSVPEWTNEQRMEFLSIAFRHAEINGDLQLDDIRLGVKMVNGSRAAMLQGAEPVSNRDELPLGYLQGHKAGLEWAAQLAEANHPQTGDWLYDDPIELAKAIRKGPDMPEADGNSPVVPDEKGSSLQLRNLIRQRHAEWSQATFGDVGPVGPLKHLSKEALEAAAEPEDLSEWADMQFLLWDAQRRAGISDVEITAAMEEKLKVNMARQWPEPKDGEPRQHIKAAPQQEVK